MVAKGRVRARGGALSSNGKRRSQSYERGIHMKFRGRPRVGLRMAIALMGATVTLGAFLVAMGSSPATAVQTATMSTSSTSGPVGTVVTLRGNAGPGCSASSFPTLTFEQGTTTGPDEFIVVPVASDGAWSATFVIPPFVGGSATRGLNGANVAPGIWHFVSPTCATSPGTEITVPFQVTGTFAAQLGSRFVGIARTQDGKGYWLTQADGGVYSYGDAGFHGSLPAGPGGLGITPVAPISAIATTPDGLGYWLVDREGGVYAFGDAGFYGSLPGEGTKPYGVVIGITPTPNGDGYWLLGADGGVFAFGDVGFYGAPTNGVAVTTLLATTDGKGYMALPANGDAPLTQGDAALPSDRQAGPMALAALVSGGAISSDAKGLWEVSTDGGIYTFGDAGFYGSLPGIRVTSTAPIVGMTRSPDGGGYWLVGADGGVFTFGDAQFFGSAA